MMVFSVIVKANDSRDDTRYEITTQDFTLVVNNGSIYKIGPSVR